jgi:hypothetical protein
VKGQDRQRYHENHRGRHSLWHEGIVSAQQMRHNRHQHLDYQGQGRHSRQPPDPQAYQQAQPNQHFDDARRIAKPCGIAKMLEPRGGGR